jgi:hypothetical protein
MIRRHSFWALSLLLLAAATSAQTLRWQKIDAAGRELPAQEGPWACVLDRESGLLWENKSDNEGVHFNAATYNRHEPARKLGSAAAGSCVAADMSVYGCDSHAFVQQARKERWCGRDDWRLPTGDELAGLLHDTGFVGDPRIVHGYFPHTGRYPYLSADLRQDAQGNHEILLVHFGSGEKIWLPISRVARLRLVSGQPR